jgi:hypothetical protein
MSSDLSEALRRLVAERADHLCEYCLVHEADVYHGCEVDHVVSVKHGGTTVPENLAYACFHCNRHKGADLGSLSLRTGKLVRFLPIRLRAKMVFCIQVSCVFPFVGTGLIPRFSLLARNRIGRVRFFNPRSDYWPQHFCLNEAHIESVTEIGEVTSRVLEFNHPERLAFRRLLMEVGRYLTVEALARLKE